MKIRQNLRHWAAKKALTTPVVSDVAINKLVDLHTKIFLEKADESAREERRAHLDGFFDATMDTYVAALEAGFTEAKAREITHIQANFDFFNHGWTEMMEIPAEEFEEQAKGVARRLASIVVPSSTGLGVDMDALLLLLITEFNSGTCPRSALLFPRRLTDGALFNLVRWFVKHGIFF
jgi:hypothetical protein